MMEVVPIWGLRRDTGVPLVWCDVASGLSGSGRSAAEHNSAHGDEGIGCAGSFVGSVVATYAVRCRNGVRAFGWLLVRAVVDCRCDRSPQVGPGIGDASATERRGLHGDPPLLMFPRWDEGGLQGAVAGGVSFRRSVSALRPKGDHECAKEREGYASDASAAVSAAPSVDRDPSTGSA